MSKKIALIDGYGFVFRAYHSLPPLTRSDGKPVGAVYGFTNMLIKLLAQLNVTHAAVVFDSGSKTFRNDIFPAYKANRPPCPEDLKPQFAIVREAAESLNLSILEKVGFEADDIIATIAKKSAAEGYEVLIVSSDKDLMQLVGDGVSMYDAMKNKIINRAEVKEKFLVEPEQVLDVLALMGDSSDNIPGVRGIGPKTAAELIIQFGDLENIFENLAEIKQEKRRQLLTDGVENARLSKVLADLKYDVELNTTLEELKIRALDPHKLISFLEVQGFRSLITRVQKEFKIDVLAVQNSSKNWEENPKENFKPKSEIAFKDVKRTEILNEEEIDKIYKDAVLNGIATIDCENNFLTISTCKTGEEPKEIFYFPLKNSVEIKTTNQTLDLFSFDESPIVQSEKTEFGISVLGKILSDDSIKKVFFDAKEFIKIAKSQHPSSLAQRAEDLVSSSSTNLTGSSVLRTKDDGRGDKDDGLIVKAYEDVSLINHLLTSSSKNDLRELIGFNLNEDIEELGFGKIFNELEKNREPEIFSDAQKKADFFCFRNFCISQLYKILAPKISELKLTTTYNNYERPLLEVLAQIELDGIKIDVEKLNQLSKDFAKKIAELSTEIYALAGEEFNIASPKQLGEILFTKLNLTSSKKSKKTGALSTGIGVLEDLEEEGHPIARKILEFRKFSKLKNTYTDALPKEINPKTNRVHTHLSSISTVTGRLSSHNPNLQNIPIKSLEGQKIRESFIAEKDHFLISADYSQIELRVIAHMAKIENLIQAFKEGKDIHKITAAQVFKIAEDEVDDATRNKAKAINFGIIYGISGFGLAKQLDISKQEAGDYIKSYLEAYPGIDLSMKNYIELARQHGYVETISGRKCFIREINNKNYLVRSEAERLAINAPIQGSAADIIKKAMIRLSKKLRAEKMSSKIILQIHDELIVEAPKDEVEAATKILKTEMENAFVLDVPLKVDVKVDKCWG